MGLKKHSNSWNEMPAPDRSDLIVRRFQEIKIVQRHTGSTYHAIEAVNELEKKGLLK